MAVTLAGLTLASILMMLVAVDLRERLLPDWLNALLALCGLLQCLLTGLPPLADALLGASLGGALMLVVALGYQKFRGISGLGLGDVKLVAAGMLWLGPQWLGPMLLIATLSALAWMLGLAGWHRQLNPREPFAFGPFLAIAILGCWGLAAAGY